MAYFKLTTFNGIAPQISPRLLKDTVGQEATDVNLDSGRLVPIFANSQTKVLDNSSKNTIFKYIDPDNQNVEFFQFEQTTNAGTQNFTIESINAVKGPIAGDVNNTLYWSGQSFPRMGRDDFINAGSEPYPSNFYRLGIPAPTAAPTVAVDAPTTISATVQTTTVGTGNVTVTAGSAHGLAVGDFITLQNFSATGGLTVPEINSDFKVDTVPGSTTFTIKTSGSATSLATSASVSDGLKKGGPHDTLTDFSTSYVYTFVSSYGEEGPPSPASTGVTTDDNQTVTLSNLETAAGTSTGRSNSNLGTGAVKRIYRSNTGSNTTAFQFVKEVSIATTSTTDTLKNAELGEIIPSTFWISPPNEDESLYPDGPMQGLTACANGVFAGFTGKRICFSEPFLPHAWPVTYRITLEDEIVAIGSTGNGVMVGTKGRPYLIVGTDPQAMSAIRLEAALACLKKESFVDMGAYVMYASPEGLVMAAGSDIRVITEGIISPTQWQSLYYPSTIRGFLWEGRYVGFYNTGSGFGGFMFDPRGGANAFVNLTASAEIRGGHTDPDTNELYLIIDDDIKQFQGDTSSFGTGIFKSKEFVLPKPTSMGFVKVEAEAYPVTVKVYGDGTLYYNATISTSGSIFSVTGSSPTSFSATDHAEPILRLPAKLHKTYAVEVQSQKTINEICIAESMDELRGI